MTETRQQGVMLILRKDDLFLLGKRSEHKQAAPGFWCPISGKIENGETQEQAVRREALEEVDLMVEPIQKVHTMLTRNKKVLLHWWTVKILSGDEKLNNDEHTELRWVTLDEMKNLEPGFPEHIEVFASLTKS